MFNANMSYVHKNYNQIKQERSKSLVALKRIYAQNVSKKINNEYNKMKSFMEENGKAKKKNGFLSGKENMKIKNLRIKK